jgi:hypothetical protein
MSMKQCFIMSKGHSKAFSTFCDSNKRFGRSRESDPLSRGRALRTHNLLSGRIKKRLLWIRWGNITRCRKALRTHFLYPGHRKKRVGWSRLSDVLSRPMALTTHNLPSESLKNQLCWSRWFDVSTCRKAMRTHFLHSVHRKSDFGDDA